MRNLLFVLFIGSLVFSCTETSVEQRLIGKWKFTRMERMDSTGLVGATGDEIEEMNKMTEGLELRFNEDNSFESRNGDKIFGKGKYRLSENKDFILSTSEDNKQSKLQIISLTDEKLVLNIDPSSYEFSAFVKVKE